MVRSKPMLAGARDQSCVNCGVSDGTIVSAHYTGLRGHLLGKGKGIKCHDLMIADLCYKCHHSFDVGYDGSSFEKKIDLSEQFLYLIAQTLLRRVDQGIITVKGYEP
jgi:hypothetical protein|tara:strand:- start:856 stop:1176 length:321 start_codon:yes stop_codon:yes gene_type:complete